MVISFPIFGHKGEITLLSNDSCGLEVFHEGGEGPGLGELLLVLGQPQLHLVQARKFGTDAVLLLELGCGLLLDLDPGAAPLGARLEHVHARAMMDCKK